MALEKIEMGDFMQLNEIILYLINNKYKLHYINSNTYLRYKSSYKIIFEYFGSVDIQSIKYDDVVTFFSYITEKYAQTTIHKVFILLCMAFKHAHNKKYVEYNVILELKEPHSVVCSKKVNALNIFEHRKLVRILSTYEKNSMYADIVLLQLNSGMRLGEILALEKQDVIGDFIRINKTLTKDENGKVIVGNKTKTYSSERMILKTVVLDSLIKHIMEYSNRNCDLLFNKNCKTITVSAVDSYLRRLNKKHCISNSLGSHKLRHTYATRAIESGMPAVVLAKKLGHKDVKMTLNIYSSVFEQFIQSKDVDFIQYLNKNALL